MVNCIKGFEDRRRCLSIYNISIVQHRKKDGFNNHFPTSHWETGTVPIEKANRFCLSLQARLSIWYLKVNLSSSHIPRYLYSVTLSLLHPLEVIMRKELKSISLALENSINVVLPALKQASALEVSSEFN